MNFLVPLDTEFHWTPHVLNIRLLCIILIASQENLFMPYLNNKDPDQPMKSNLYLKSVSLLFTTNFQDSNHYIRADQFETYLRQVFSWCGSIVSLQVLGWKLNHIGMNPTAEAYLVLHRFGSVGDQVRSWTCHSIHSEFLRSVFDMVGRCCGTFERLHNKTNKIMCA